MRGTSSDCAYGWTNPTSDYDATFVYDIPVVVHIIQRTNGTGAITDAKVQSQIDILNEDFLALAGTNGANGTYCAIQFHLATVDPSGNTTNGITRSTNDTWFNDSGSYWNSLAWDTNEYLNIYTNSAAGYLGYVPDLPQGGIVGSNADRVVILWSSFGRNGPIGPPYNQGRTTTHEVGHYFGLWHTFDGGCASVSNCYNNGDRICDTNAESQPVFGCPGSKTSCSSPDPYHNYMDYSDDLCMEEFTPEQMRRIRCTIEFWRSNLPDGGGTTDPTADFSGAPTGGPAPLLVNFTDASTGTGLHTWAWDFGDGGSSSVPSPSHTYASPGTYTVALTVTGTAGSDIESKAGYIVVDQDPLADFTATPTSGDEDLFVVFTSLSTGTGLSTFAWSFGDGGSSSLANPAYTYVDPGTYTVSLTVTGTNGSDTETKTNYIVVNDVANAAATPYNGSGINPNILTSVTLPILGTTWKADIDGGSIGATGISFLVGYSAPITGIFTGVGELLIDVTSSWMFTSVAGGSAGISHHTLAIPNDAALAGIHSYVQGFLNNVGGAGKLTNAYDLELGN